MIRWLPYPSNILCLFLLWWSSEISAQGALEKGKLVLMNNDTLNGYFYVQSLESPKPNVLFKRTLKSKSKSFNKKQIKSLDSEFIKYGSFEYLNQKLITLEPLTVRQRDTVITYLDTFFMELVVEGGINLYRRHEEKEPERFFVLVDGRIDELINYSLPAKGFITTDQYKLQLQDYLTSCKSKYDSRRIHYEEKDLAAAILRENECRKNLLFSKNLKTNWRWQVVAGYTASIMRYVNLAINKWRDRNWTSTNLPLLGVSVTPMQFHKPNRYLFVTEAFFQHQRTQTPIKFNPGFFYESGIVNFETFNLKMNLLGQAYIRNRGLKLYVVGGISNSFPLSIPTNNLRIMTSDLAGNITERVDDAIRPGDLLGYDAYFLFGGGIEYDRFTIELRRDYSDGLSKNLSLVSNYRNTYLIFKYRL